MSDSSVSVFDWPAPNVQGITTQVALFNCDAMAAATQVESNKPFCISINGTNYLAYKRHATAVMNGLGLGDMSTLLTNIDRVKNDLASMGILGISMNSCNAENDLAALPELINMKCNLRFEFVLDIEDYSLSKISSNHRRNIKKSQKIHAQIAFPNGVSAMQSHIDMVNSNLSKKGLGGLTNSPEYFNALLDRNAGLLVQVNQDEQLLASTFFLINEDYAYYHSSGASEHGRQSGAAHFLVDGMVNEMRERQIRYLNFGGCTSEQSGLYRFKLGFRPETQILFSAHRQLASGLGQKLRLLLATRPGDILNITRESVYLKNLVQSTTVKDSDYVGRILSFSTIFEAVSKNPELGKSLTNCVLTGSHCYALEDEKGAIIATGFVDCKDAQVSSDKAARQGPANGAEIGHFYVVQSMRNKGVGKALLVFLERQLSEMGCDQAHVKLDPYNTVAKALFIGRGFRLIGEEKTLSTKLFGGKQRVLGKIGSR